MFTIRHMRPSYSVFEAPTQIVEGLPRFRIQTRATNRSINPPRVFGVSDIHTDYLENFAWAEALDKQAFRNDILLLAGDVCDELTLLEDTLTLLKPRFGSVFYCPGNHCLWIRSTDVSSNSFEKLQRILTLCTSLGIYTTPKRIENVWVAPIQSWHHKSFDSDPDIPDIPAASALTIADYAACTWPTEAEGLLPPGSQRNGSIELAQWFDSLNDGALWEEMLDTRDKCDVISFSHFLPDITLMPEKRFLFYPNLVKASGSLPLAKRIDVLKPDIHLFGHTHFAWDSQIEGTRYIQAPLGAPLERHRRLGTLCFNAFMKEDKENKTRISSSSTTSNNKKNKSSSATGSTVWTTRAGDPTQAKWLPVELYQFNSYTDLSLIDDGISVVDNTSGAATVSVNSSSSSSSLSSMTECEQEQEQQQEKQQHRGPNEPLRDAFTTANEATHGILPLITDDSESIISGSSASDDDPLSLFREEGQEESQEVSKNVAESRLGGEERKQLKHGTMPGGLGAHWSEYYAKNPRQPEITTLAPWVAHLYQKRRQRRENGNKNEKKTPPAAAAGAAATLVD